MNCDFGEKLILYRYGEAGPGLAAEAEAHLRACPACRAELAALDAAEAALAAAPALPPERALSFIMRAARAAAAARRRPVFRWGEALLSGALASLLGFFFAFGGQRGSADLAWNSGLDSKLDSVEYSVYQEQSDLGSASGDWEYGLSAVEDEGYDLSRNV